MESPEDKFRHAQCTLVEDDGFRIEKQLYLQTNKTWLRSLWSSAKTNSKDVSKTILVNNESWWYSWINLIMTLKVDKSLQGKNHLINDGLAIFVDSKI